MIPGGYILQPRCFDRSDSAHLPPCTREVWFYLLRNVNHADKGKYKRGQAFFQFADIQNALHWYVGNSRRIFSKPQISKAIGRLRDETMLETAKATRGIIVTVLNYDYYQDPGNYEGNAEGNPKETRRFYEGDAKNKKLRSKEVKKGSKDNGRFTPPTLEEVKAYCLERKNGIDPQGFLDHYDTNGWVQGQGNKKVKDWMACVRTWENKRKKKESAAPRQPKHMSEL